MPLTGHLPQRQVREHTVHRQSPQEGEGVRAAGSEPWEQPHQEKGRCPGEDSDLLHPPFPPGAPGGNHLLSHSHTCGRLVEGLAKKTSAAAPKSASSTRASDASVLLAPSAPGALPTAAGHPRGLAQGAGSRQCTALLPHVPTGNGASPSLLSSQTPICTMRKVTAGCPQTQPAQWAEGNRDEGHSVQKYEREAGFALALLFSPVTVPGRSVQQVLSGSPSPYGWRCPREHPRLTAPAKVHTTHTSGLRDSLVFY